MPARTTAIPTPAEPTAPAHEDASQLVPIGKIDPNPLQPRRTFESDKLAELAQSIRANGIIQPLIVRKAAGRFQLVAGERRLRASKLAGLTEVPVVVQDISDDHLLEITLIENIQREDLNPIEEAIAFERLGRELNIIPEEIGRRTGKDRSTIVNTIRLLQLPQEVQQLLIEGTLKQGHARSLLKLPSSDLQREIAIRAAAQEWSVRQVERATQKIIESSDPKKAKVETIDPNVKAAISEMERSLGTKVRIVEKSGKKGRIEIEYYSQEDLDRIYEIVVKP